MTGALLLAALLGAAPAPGQAAGAAPPDPGFDDGWLDAAVAALPSARPFAPLGAAPPAGAGPAWLHRAAALQVDALPSAPPLRRPLPSRPPAEGTLGATLEAEKGAALLAMLEGYAGAERFRGALEAWRAARGGAGADADPLLLAVAAAAGQDVAGALRGFLERPGVPLLHFATRCERGSARLSVRQERLLAGGTAPAAPPWTVPLCVRAGGARGEVTVCALVAGPAGELLLPFCPAWLWPNAGGAGYPVSALAPREVAAAWPHLSVEERLAAAVDAALLARAGAAPASEALALVGPLSGEADARLGAAALLLARLADPGAPAGPERAAWQAFLRRTFGARARALGWLPRPDDDEAARALRPVLLPLVAGEGAEAVLAGEALALARRWLEERRQVPPEVAWPALEAAAAHGDRQLFELVAAAAAQAEPAERLRLRALLGAFRDPGVAPAALALAGDPATPAGDAAALLAAALAGPDTAPAALAALPAAWDALAPRLEAGPALRLVEAAARAACEPARRAALAAFLAPRAAPLDGPAVALALEAADACLAARERLAPAAARLWSPR